MTSKHTADHIDQNQQNDTIVNIRWLCKTGQSKNRIVSKEYKSSFIIVKDGVEKTVKEWVDSLKNEKNPFGREYTLAMIRKYAQKKQLGFSYKNYPNLTGEVWEEIEGSDNKLGCWKISNMCRVKYITKYAENVLSEGRLGLDKGYPTISINGKHYYCHILSFMTFFPKEYATKKSHEIVLHEDDDKTDFRPHKLRLGTQSDNITDAYNNGCYNGTKSARTRCASYISGIFEKEYDSQTDAVKYLISKGFDKAARRGIRFALAALHDGQDIIRYGRTWKLVV
jgi:hypothetical protein